MPPDSEPKTPLGRILREHPEAREPLGRAVGGLLAAVLATVVAICALSIWHLRRRGDRIRDRLGTARGRDLEPPDPRLPTDEDDPA